MRKTRQVIRKTSISLIFLENIFTSHYKGTKIFYHIQLLGKDPCSKVFNNKILGIYNKRYNNMSVMVNNTDLLNKTYENKEKYEEVNENTCEICYNNMKSELIKCKVCHNKICFNCFDKYEVKDYGIANVSDEVFENGNSHIYLNINCFFCRECNNYNIGSFPEKERNILTNKLIKDEFNMRKTLQKDGSNTDYGDNYKDKKIYELARENEELRLNFLKLQYIDDKYLETKAKFDNIMINYNKNIDDYNMLVRDTKFLKTINQNLVFANNQYTDFIDMLEKDIIDIETSNKNKNLHKKILKIKQKFNISSVRITAEFNELLEK